MTRPPHVLIAEIDPDNHERLSYSIDCPGVTDSCRTYWECREDHPEAAGEWDEEEEIHGVPHRRIPGLGWSIPSGQCYVANHDALPEEGEEIARGRVGRWPVDHEVGDGTELYLHEIKPSAPAATLSSATTPGGTQ